MKLRRWFKKLRRWSQTNAIASTSSPANDADLPFVLDETGTRIFLSHERRRSLYAGGVAARLAHLLSDYRIKADLISAGDLVIDIGANNGELGLWTRQRGGSYIGFEPDPFAFAALSRNLPDQRVFNVALSNEDGEQAFFLATAEADSSLFKPMSWNEQIIVQTRRLDGMMETIGINRCIKLLKVEAEGMEPEVIEGARHCLRNVDYVAVDAGPERSGETTAPEVLNMLFGAGFELIDCFLLRGTFLMRRRGS